MITKLLLCLSIFAGLASATGFSCAAGSAHCVQLLWTAPTTGGTPTSYNVKRSLVSGGPYVQVGSVSATATEYIDNSTPTNPLSEGATYFYVVTSANSSGESAPSNEASAKIPVTAPQAPMGLSTMVQ